MCVAGTVLEGRGLVPVPRELGNHPGRLTLGTIPSILYHMKLTIQLQLLPTAAQVATLLNTMARVNEAASFAARLAFDAGVFSMPSIHRLAYFAIRERFGLSAQLAVRAAGKAVEAFQRDKTACPVFRPDGAITYDQRNL